MKFYVTKIIEFASAHRLRDYKGDCVRMHGHNYKVEVTVSADKLNCLGMAVDFGTLKDMVNTWLKMHFDHKLLLNSEDDLLMVYVRGGREVEVYVFEKSNPTAENMALKIMDALKDAAKRMSGQGGRGKVRAETVKLWETSTSFVEIRNEDNDCAVE